MRSLNTHPVSEINRKATHILFEQIGVVDTFKFFNQFTIGEGDYTKERDELFKELTLDEIIDGIKQQR